MAHAPYFSTAALSVPPVARLVPDAGRTDLIDVSGAVPTFPPSELLDIGTFKIVIGSWRRINPHTSTTTDFEVNVGEYAPREPFVTRVILTDVDIPPVQRLIESGWSRLYFGQGLPTSVNCRDVTFTFPCVQGGNDDCQITQPPPGCVIGNNLTTVTTVLPLPLDMVTTYVKIAPATVQIFTEHRAPAPIQPLAAAWAQLSCRKCGTLQLLGVAGVGPFELTPDIVADDTAQSFFVYSAALYNALPATPPTDDACKLYLQAAPIPGPTFMAALLTSAMTTLLGPYQWQLSFAYDRNEDKFSATVRAPGLGGSNFRGLMPPSNCGPCPVEPPYPCTLGGAISSSLGFGPALRIYVPAHEPITVGAVAARYHDTYAQLQEGNPGTADVLVSWVQTALNTYTWSSFTFSVRFPPNAAVVVTVPGGQMLLSELAVAINQQFALLGLAIEAEESAECLLPGLTFRSTATPQSAFELDFTPVSLTVVDARRLGYNPVLYPPSVHHVPQRAATHIPLLSVCGDQCFPLKSNFRAVLESDTGQMVLSTVPFPPFTAAITSVAPACGPSFTTAYTVATTAYRPGLQVGAFVNLTTNGTVQQPCVVIEVVDSLTFVARRLDALSADFVPGAVTVIPVDQPPLDIYAQPPVAERNVATSGSEGYRPSGINVHTFGLHPYTLEACSGDITTPGTVDPLQNPYILVCLSFQSGTGLTSQGNVYYPFERPSSYLTVFAKITRSSLLRADYEKVFEYNFNGSGIHLSSVRVRILNPNGTAFDAHGHPVSVTLRFDTRQSMVKFGGGHVTVPALNNEQLGGAWGPPQQISTSRGTVYMRPGWPENAVATAGRL